MTKPDNWETFAKRLMAATEKGYHLYCESGHVFVDRLDTSFKCYWGFVEALDRVDAQVLQEEGKTLLDYFNEIEDDAFAEGMGSAYRPAKG